MNYQNKQIKSIFLQQTNERKREAQLITAKQEIRKEYFAKKEENKLTGEKARAVDEEMKAAIDKLMAESEEKKKQYEKELKGYQEELFEYTTYVGEWGNYGVTGGRKIGVDGSLD